jgi:anaerobic magnesium-protoporphyrin IX monomethyl ester cyclase
MKCLVSTIPTSLNPPLKNAPDPNAASPEPAPHGTSSYSAYELARLRSLLRAHGHEVLGVDIARFSRARVAALIEEFSPDAVIVDATSFQDHAQRHGLLQFFLLVKTLSPRTRTIWGGRDAAALASFALTHSLVVDVILCDESDTTLPPLLRRLDGADDPRLEDIPGLAFRVGDEVRCTRRAVPHELVALDTLPFLDYGGIRFAPNDWPIVMSSRGCPYGCRFCYRQYRSRRCHSPSYFVDHLEYLQREFGFERVKIDDELFTLGRDRCVAICSGIAARGLRLEFDCYSKVNGFDDDLARALKRGGCRMVWFGLESGSDALLTSMDKQQTPRDVVHATRAAKRAGLDVCCNVLLGYPGETNESLLRTLQLLDVVRPDQLSVQRLRLMPKTDLSNWCEDQGALDDEAWLLDQPDFTYERDFSREGLDVLVRFIGQVTAKAGGLEDPDVAKYLILKGHRPVCGCKAVGEGELSDAWHAGAATVKALKTRTGAISGCGTCAGLVATWLRVCQQGEARCDVGS